MDKGRFMVVRFAIALAILAGLSACGGGGGPAAPPPNTGTADGFRLSVFVKAPSATQKPDSIVQMGDSVFIAYQNAGEVKDGSVPGVTNAVVKYDLFGNLLKTYTVPGHCDGLMARSDTNTLWAMSNEDGNPELTIIDLASGAQKTYQATVNPTLHGGGYDDMQLINGVVYVTASAPANPGTAPSVVSLTLNPNGSTFDVAPVLAGNAQAIDLTPKIGGSANPTYKQMVTLNLTDPDSMATDPSGDLVVDSQGDGKLVFIQNPGPNQIVSVLALTLFNDKDGPTELVDDTRFVPPPGPQGIQFMLFTDANSTTYVLNGPFVTGEAYSAGQGLVARLDTKTGHEAPITVSIGDPLALQDPHGMVFVTK